jgi:hypothetical protein
MSSVLRVPRLLAVPALCLAAAFMAAPSHAQFAMVPTPLPATVQPSEADSDQAYRKDGAKHLYSAYPMRIWKGRMPPLLYGVAIVETELDVDGNVIDVRFRRPPGAAEVAPWIAQMIRKAGPFPAPTKLGKATYVDVWLVHKGGNFQLDTLTEGQN